MALLAGLPGPSDPPRQGGTSQVPLVAQMQAAHGVDDPEPDTHGDSVQVDPLLGILGALADLPKGWRAVSQLIVLAPAPHGWARAFPRLALERPLDQGRRADTGPSPAGPLALLGLVGLYVLGANVSDAWARGDWFFGLALVFGTLAVIVGSIVVLRWLRKRELVDPRLVQAKLSRDACVVELRLLIIAPAFANADLVQARLDRLVAAYRPFALATGNSLVPRAVARGARDLRVLAALYRPSLLNVRELAGLWHLPQASDDVVFLERTTARRRLPLKSTVAQGADGAGCRIGVSSHQNHSVPVLRSACPPAGRLHLPSASTPTPLKRDRVRSFHANARAVSSDQAAPAAPQ